MRFIRKKGSRPKKKLRMSSFVRSEIGVFRSNTESNEFKFSETAHS